MTRHHDRDDAGPSTLPSAPAPLTGARAAPKRSPEPLIDSEAMRVIAITVLPWLAVAAAAAVLALCLG